MNRFVVAAAIALCCLSGSSATLINLINNCPYGITAFARSGSAATNKYNLGARGGHQQLNVGPSWPAGLVWASPTGSQNNAQATQLEMTAGANGRDTYDISLVNAYNLPASIQPINIVNDSVKGHECGTPTCTIGDLQSFCKPPNQKGATFCTNTDGPGKSATAGTKAFKSACPDAYSYSTDDATSTWGCHTGTNYNFVFCPQVAE